MRFYTVGLLSKGWWLSAMIDYADPWRVFVRKSWSQTHVDSFWTLFLQTKLSEKCLKSIDQKNIIGLDNLVHFLILMCQCQVKKFRVIFVEPTLHDGPIKKFIQLLHDGIHMSYASICQ